MFKTDNEDTKLLKNPLSRSIDNEITISDNPKKEAILSLFVLLIPVVIVNSLFLFTGGSAVPITSYTFDDVIHDWTFWGVLFIVPVFGFLLIRKQRINTVGIRTLNTGRNIVISLIIVTILLWVRMGFLFDFFLSTGVLLFWLMERRNLSSSEIEVIAESPNKLKKINEFIQGLYLRPLMLGTTVIGVLLIFLGPYMRGGNDPMREFIRGYSFLFFLFALCIVTLKIISWKFSDRYSRLTRNQHFNVLFQSRFLVLGSLIVVITSLMNYSLEFFTNLHIVYFTLLYFILMLLFTGFLDIFLVVEFFYFRFQEGDQTRNTNYSVLLGIITLCSI